MNIFYPIKKKIIESAFEKRKKNKPYNVEESELYELKGDELWYVNNSYFFGGHSLKDKTSLVLRLGTRNKLDDELFVFFRNKDYFLVTPKDYYDKKEEPLKVKCIKPGVSWNVTFDGELLDKNTNKLLKVEFSIDFEARREIYDFFYSYKNKYMIEAVAHCKWGKNFKEEMAKTEQRHYEQPGFLKGEITIDGKKQSIDLPGGRDHSFGLRDWDAMNDHIWLFAFKDNGEIFNYSIVNYPLLKNINCGYIDVNRNELVSIDRVNKLEYDANNGLGLDDFDLEIKFLDGKVSKIHVHREANHETHYQNGDYYFQEGIGEFTIDGEKLYGSIEFGFNKDNKKWEINNK